MGSKLLRGKIGILFLMAVLLVFAAASWGAEYANPQLLADAKLVAENAGKPDWVVIDCRDRKDYDAGHIPGAVSLGAPCGKVLRDTSLRVKKTEDLEKMLGEAGVSMDKNVVVYADAKLITSASVAFWALEYLGHDKVRLLNGGIEAWKGEGKALDTAETAPQPATFKAKIVKSRIASSDEVLRVAKGQAKGVNLIDGRTGKENKGEDIRSLRGGHIPNTTKNVSHIDTYDPQTGVLHTMDELQSEKLYAGLDKSKRSIAYCQTGTRSTLTYLELRLMGFKDPANYDDSWIIYGSNVDYPVANENWYDFVKANDAIKAIDEIKKDLEEMKKARP